MEYIKNFLVGMGAILLVAALSIALGYCLYAFFKYVVFIMVVSFVVPLLAAVGKDIRGV